MLTQKSSLTTESGNFLEEIGNALGKVNEKICTAAGGKLPEKQCGASEAIGND